jgi:hypothetical protein
MFGAKPAGQGGDGQQKQSTVNTLAPVTSGAATSQSKANTPVARKPTMESIKEQAARTSAVDDVATCPTDTPSTIGPQLNNTCPSPDINSVVRSVSAYRKRAGGPMLERTRQKEAERELESAAQKKSSSVTEPQTQGSPGKLSSSQPHSVPPPDYRPVRQASAYASMCLFAINLFSVYLQPLPRTLPIHSQ